MKGMPVQQKEEHVQSCRPDPTVPYYVPCPVHSTLFPTSVCRSRPSVQGFPWPRAFSPRTPPVVGLLIRLSTFVRSLHRYYAPVRLPKCVRVGRTATAFSDRTDRDSRSVTLGISRFPCMELAYMPWFSDSAGPVTSLTIAQRLVMPSPSLYWVGNPKG